MPPKRANPAAGTAASAEFELCELCRRNHDQGRRHRYFPSHRASLAAALTRFRSKLSDLRRAVIHGTSSSASSQQPRPRLWCPFCAVDLVDLDSRSACADGLAEQQLNTSGIGSVVHSNAIHHLASSEHLKGVKDFLRKHGGGMDQVDSLRISEDELTKWEKGCESLSTGAKEGTEGLIKPSLGQMKAMGYITLLVQRVMELLVVEALLILLHMELLDRPMHLGDWPIYRSSRVC